MKKNIFEPLKIGPITIRNRTIRSAGFEGMCPEGIPSQSLIDYHSAVARGGIGMTTVAYASVNNQGRTFSHQAYMSPEVIAPFKKLTDAVHKEGASVSIQLGHGGNMGDVKVCGQRPVAPSAKINLFGLTIPRAMNLDDIKNLIEDHKTSVLQAKESGFDAVEIHAGHGYLISQFISKRTNKRKDLYGGSLENRTRLLKEILETVREAAGKDMAVIVKMNLEDGFKGGQTLEDAKFIAQLCESSGVDAIEPSAGFVSKTPFYMMRGRTPHKRLISYQSDILIKLSMVFFSRLMLKDYKYEPNFLLEQTKEIINSVKIPVISVGGILSQKDMQRALDEGCEALAIARALVAETDFINKTKNDSDYISPCKECGPCNDCVATMYMGEMRCTYLEEK